MLYFSIMTFVVHLSREHRKLSEMYVLTSYVVLIHP